MPIQACENSLFGTILLAYGHQNKAIRTYEPIDRKMVWDVTSSGSSSWKGRDIRDPSSDKTYESRVSLANGTLHVSRFVLMFCQTQNWTRVQ
ncbi:MAG: DUF2147 domain-containing protein [Granulosicoccus sp.]